MPLTDCCDGAHPAIATTTAALIARYLIFRPPRAALATGWTFVQATVLRAAANITVG
jgi:hypothetical protein